MSSLPSIIQATQLLQDVEVSQALQQMDPQSLQQYLQNAQQSLYKDVTSHKDEAIQKAYGDFERAASTEHAILYYKQRNQDLDTIQGQVYADRKGSADAVLHDRDLAKRQYEINQWETSNKMDTLFVYQQMLIILSAIVVMSYLWQNNILSSVVFFALLFVLVCIFVFTVVDRSQYTNFLRDGRYWNRRQFPSNSKTPTPSGPCSLENALESAYQETQQAVDQGAQDAQNAYNQAGQDASQASQGVQNAYNQSTQAAQNALPKDF